MARSRMPAPRVEVRLPVELGFDRSELLLAGESRNMSTTGMLVVAEDPKPPGTRVRFSFEDFSGTAVVVWGREAEEGGSYLGMKFTGLEGRARSTLTRLLRDGVPYH